MSKFRTSRLGTSLLAAVATAALSVSASASAASFQLWNGTAWVDNGTVHYQGPVVVNYLWVVACNADFTVTVTGGNASVTAASFSGISACTAIQAQNRPWPLVAGTPYTGSNPPFSGAPILTPPLLQVQFNGVRLFAPAPLNIYCPNMTGSINVVGVMESSGRIVFRQPMAACLFQTQSNSYLTPNVPIRVI